MRIAIVHDWLVAYAGSERVLEQMLAVYPTADVYTLIDFLPKTDRGFLSGRDVHTSFLQRLPGMRRGYRNFLPLMAVAVEQFDLSGYDLVLSSSHAVAKGVLTGPDQLHLSMCYSPMRYAWDLQHQYLRQTGLAGAARGLAARWMLHRMRIWDVRTSNGVDGFIAISRFVARRIWKVYRREATVIYPPVDVESFTPGGIRDDYYLTASRLVPYKRVDLIVAAFAATPTRRLLVIGDGPELHRLRHQSPPNVEFLGSQPLSVLRDHMRSARAFLFAAEEDFGIAPLEAQACGTPVLAYGKAGALETLHGLDSARPTAIYFPEQTAESIVGAVDRFERDGGRITPVACRENAVRFAVGRFRREFRACVDAQLEARHTGRGNAGG